MSQVLARVTTGHHELPRGADVTHRITVERSWLERGELVELQLPRNLTCASCDGGGCDRCDRSGAISLRRRSEPIQRLQVTLPRRSLAEIDEQPALMLRIPEQGGHANPAAGLPRGVLLLKVVAADTSEATVSLLSRESVERGSLHATAPAGASPLSRRRLRQRRLLAVCGLAVVLAVVAYLFTATH